MPPLINTTLHVLSRVGGGSHSGGNGRVPRRNPSGWLDLLDKRRRSRGNQEKKRLGESNLGATLSRQRSIKVAAAPLRYALKKKRKL